MVEKGLVAPNRSLRVVLALGQRLIFIYIHPELILHAYVYRIHIILINDPGIFMYNKDIS